MFRDPPRKFVTPAVIVDVPSQEISRHPALLVHYDRRVCRQTDHLHFHAITWGEVDRRDSQRFNLRVAYVKEGGTTGNRGSRSGEEI